MVKLIHTFNKPEINVLVTGGEANGYWQILGARYRRCIVAKFH